MILGRIRSLIHWRLQSKSLGTKVHWTSYVDLASTLAGSNSVAQFSKVHDSRLGKFSYLAARAVVVRADLGSYCSIGPDTQVGGLDRHPISMFSTSPVFYDKNNPLNIVAREIPFAASSRVSIGSDVWIGARAIVLSGVNISTGCVIGAGSVVVRNTEPYGVYAGVPARLIRFRFPPDQISDLLSSQWWCLEPGLALKLISSSNIESKLQSRGE